MADERKRRRWTRVVVVVVVLFVLAHGLTDHAWTIEELLAKAAE